MNATGAAPASTPWGALPSLLHALRDVVARSTFPLAAPSADDARAEARAVVRQLDDYLLPRLARLDAPLLVVVGGSTGAGKSTLVNSVVRRPVSPAGVLRPTTRAPVLVHHREDAAWFAGGDVLPGVPRADDAGGVAGALRLVPDWRVPRGMALLDAPDIDSVVAMNRDLAAQLLAAADLWLFVTSAARYADAVPWQALRDARRRTTAVAVVLDRVPAGAEEELTAELARMLEEQGLGDAPLFTVAEAPTDDDGMLAEDVVAELRSWLVALAADRAARDAVVRRTLGGALAALRPRVEGLAVAADEQAGLVRLRREDVRNAYDAAATGVADGVRDGAVLRGEVLARWQELVGTGDLMRGLQTRVGRLRDRLSGGGRRPPAAELEIAIEGGVESLVRTEADGAAERAAAAWQATADGRALCASGAAAGSAAPLGAQLARSAPDLPERSRHMVREWQSAVLDLVRTEGVGRRRSARLLAYGVNGLGLLVMVTVFTHTGGLTGVEGGVAAGASVVGQRVLEALLGDQAVRRLASKARDDLLERVRALLDEEAERFLARLPEPAAAAEELRQAAAAVAAEAGRVLPPSPAPLPPRTDARKEDS